MALSIAPSDGWYGIDGNWSTFYVKVGTPEQQLEVLPATSLSFIGVVLSQGCPSSYGDDCESSRGSVFSPTPSDSSWIAQDASGGDTYFDFPTIGPFKVLPEYEGITAEVGLDSVKLDWVADNEASAPPLLSQVIAGYATTIPWLGFLGLSGTQSHFNNATGAGKNSILETFLERQNISSLYWAYTAGAYGRETPAWGSLTFGGYDALRRNSTSAINATISGGNNQLQLSLTGASVYNGTTAATTYVDGLPVDIAIDSLVPEIWLPQSACENITDQLGLVWNDTLELYPVSDSQHASLTAQNLAFTFQLAASTDSSSSVSITLPYSAFDMSISWPAANLSTDTPLRYFPLKQTTDPDQYYLGRTFLQYAYVTADYESQDFTVAQALFPSNQSAVELVVAVSKRRSGLTTGTIAGIAVGAVAALALVAGLAFWLLWRRHRRTKASRSVEKAGGFQGPRLTSFDMSTIVASSDVAEMDNREFYKPPVASADRADPYYKAELDATATAGWPTGKVVQRAELDAGSVRRPKNQHGMSWGSGVSGVSELSNDRIRSAFSEPSPPLQSGGSPPPPASPRSGHLRQDSDGSVPAVSPRSGHSRQHSDGSVPPASPRSGHGRQFSVGTPFGPFEIG